MYASVYTWESNARKEVSPELEGRDCPARCSLAYLRLKILTKSSKRNYSNSLLAGAFISPSRFSALRLSISVAYICGVCTTMIGNIIWTLNVWPTVGKVGKAGNSNFGSENRQDENGAARRLGNHWSFITDCHIALAIMWVSASRAAALDRRARVTRRFFALINYKFMYNVRNHVYQNAEKDCCIFFWVWLVPFYFYLISHNFSLRLFFFFVSLSYSYFVPSVRLTKVQTEMCCARLICILCIFIIL